MLWKTLNVLWLGNYLLSQIMWDLVGKASVFINVLVLQRKIKKGKNQKIHSIILILSNTPYAWIYQLRHQVELIKRRSLC